MFDTRPAILLAEETTSTPGGQMMKSLRLVSLAQGRDLFLVLMLLCAPALDAAEYPTKTVQIINPFPPGAVTDIVARILAPKMSAALGQPVVIVRPVS